jgi:hypothetical protein
MAWVNNPEFPGGTIDAGYDPFIAQPPNGKQLQTTLFDKNDNVITPGLGNFPKLVTMKGGEYFFVPSISALSGELGSA